MKVLGVNAGQASLWLCVVGDEGPEDTDPSSLTLLDGPVGGHALVAFHSECARVLSRLTPDRVVILDPEPTAPLPLSSARPRFSAEAILALAAEQAGIDCERIARATVRSRHQLGRKGALKAHVKSVVPESAGPYWGGKRDLAALAALAVREG